MYKVIFSPTAEKQLRKIDKSIQKRIIGVLERIRIRPRRYLSKLSGLPYYKLRVGNYRLILDVFDDMLVIYVIKLGHRRNIYKKLK